MTLTPLRFGWLALVSVLLGSGTPLAAQAPPTTPPETPPAALPATPPASALRLSGVVLDARAGTPVELADVEAVSPSATVRGRTDAEGRFTLEIAVTGGLRLRVSRQGYATLSFDIPAPAAALTSGAASGAPSAPPPAPLVFRLEPAPLPLSAVVVTPGFFGAGAGAASGASSGLVSGAHTLTPEHMQATPQLGDDVFRAVARLPGVAAADLSAGFGLRGSRPDQVLVRLDGLELYEPFHFKDLDNIVSIIDVQAIGSVELMTGGFGAQFGDRIGGVFDLRTAGVEPGKAKTEVGLSTTFLRGSSRGSFAGDRGRWLVSARRGYLDLALRMSGTDENIDPRFHDVLGKVEYAVGRQTVSLHLLQSLDRMTYEDGPNDPRIESDYGSQYLWMGLQGPVGRWGSVGDRGPIGHWGLSHQTTLATGQLSWFREGGRGTSRIAFPSGVTDERDFRFVSLRTDWTKTWSDRSMTRSGADVRHLNANYRYEGWKRRAAPIDGVVVQWTDTIRADLAPRGAAAEAWILQRMRLIPSLIAEAGVHFAFREHTGDADWTPRLNLAWAPSEGTAVRASWGRHAQSQGIHELAVADGVQAFAPSEHAEQWGLGIEHMPARHWTVRVEAYDRTLTRIRPRWVNLDHADDLFPEASSARTRIEPERGRARGLELSAARQVARGLSTSASVTVSSAYDRVQGRDAPRARDQRVALGFDLGWRPIETLQFGAAWVYHSGWPYTRASYEIVTLSRGGRWVERTHEPYNSSRLPAYHRMDVRGSWRIPTSKGDVSVVFDVFNLFSRRNVSAQILTTSVDARGSLRTRERVETMLPRLPMFGVTWRF